MLRRATPVVVVAAAVLLAAGCGPGAPAGHRGVASRRRRNDRLEQEGHLGAPTFRDYATVTGRGPEVPAMAKVEISCRVYDPSIPSAEPDGYWYRIASKPWDDRYYAVANTFFNGDPINGPYRHNTDFKVRTC